MSEVSMYGTEDGIVKPTVGPVAGALRPAVGNTAGIATRRHIYPLFCKPSAQSAKIFVWCLVFGIWCLVSGAKREGAGAHLLGANGLVDLMKLLPALHIYTYIHIYIYIYIYIFYIFYIFYLSRAPPGRQWPG